MVKRELPLDVLRNILLRVPSKCVLRSKAISKDLKDLISDPLFIREKHRQEQSKLSPNFLEVELDSNFPDKDRDKKSWYFTFTSLDSHGRETQKFTKEDVALTGRNDEIWWRTTSTKYGGLVCIHANCVPINGSNKDLVYICNPVTRQLVLLPQCSPNFYPHPRVYTITQVVFGYSPSSDEYKIARLFFTKFHNIDYIYNDHDESDEIKIGEYEISCEIVSFSGSYNKSIQEVSCWRVIKNKCPYIPNDNSIFVNNCFYWCINEDYMRSQERKIIILDTINYKFGSRLDPKLIKESEEDEDGMIRRISLIELENELGICKYNKFGQMINLYKIEDYENWIWKKVYKIRFHDDCNHHFKLSFSWDWPHIQCTLNDGREVMFRSSFEDEDEDEDEEEHVYRLINNSYYDTILSLS